MSTRLFGQGKRPVGAVGLGCMSFGGQIYGPADDGQSLDAMARALEIGVDFWDVANIYGRGHSEVLIGRFIAQDRARRDRIVLASKFGIKSLPGGGREIDNSPAYMRECLDGSLQRLGVDHIDLYYVHRAEPGKPIEDIVGALADQVTAGKIGAIGLSEVSPDTLRRAHAVHPIAAVQSEYSLWVRAPELGMIEACRELGTSFVAFSPLGRGYFTTQIDDPSKLEPGDFRRDNPRFTGINWARNLAARRGFIELAGQWGLTPARLAIAWTLARGEHIIPIPGTRYAEHIVENTAAADAPLSAEQLATLERILPAGFAAGDRYADPQWLGVERYG